MQAGASDLVLLDERDRLAEFRGTQRRGVSAAAATQDDEIESVVGHQDSSVVTKRIRLRTVAAVGPLSVKP